MKRYVFLVAALSAFLAGAIALAQSTTLPAPADQQVLKLLEELQQREGAGSPNADRLREVERAVRQAYQQRAAELQQVAAQSRNAGAEAAVQAFSLAQRGGAGGRGAGPATLNNGAWWTNAALVERLGLTEDQKARIERAFENHKVDLAARTETLSKEEAQLAKLLEADTIPKRRFHPDRSRHSSSKQNWNGSTRP